METTPAFVCSKCGERHDGLPMDMAFKLPDAVHAIPEPDRAARITSTSDFCELGERRFYRCVLLIPIIGRDESFAWGVWVEVTPTDFRSYVTIYNDDIADAGSQVGRLANRIPSYEDSLDTPVTITFGSADDRPTLWLEATSETTLAREQRHGISESRYHEMLEAAGAA